MTVVAACHSGKSEGAEQLRKKCKDVRLHVIELDITNISSITQAHDYINKLIASNPGCSE
jgi:hypothetical protein